MSTEIICPDGVRVLVPYATMSEVRQAIQEAYQEKRNQRTNLSYTAIKVQGNRSFVIEKNSPEKAMGCSLRQDILERIQRNYIRHF